jgi:phage terminase small subunit
MRPNRQLPISAPAQIKGMKVAAETWRRIMREYRSTEGEIVTRFDLDLLVDYCVLAEQVSELDGMRATAREIYKHLSKQYREFMRTGQETEAIMMASKVQGAFDSVVKLDSRVDRKRDLMFKMRQHLYLTPRSRAGVAPKAKEPEDKRDNPWDEFFNDVTDFVNDGKDEK